ncbi:MAG: molybdenum cofactor guanylyltransferase [Candidatus Methylomirabilales bacterium]
MTITGVVLAGGESTRMGRNKAVLEIGGKRLIDRLIDGLKQIFPEVIIVANTPGLFDYLGVRVVPDLIPDKGSLGGIYTATATASHPWTFLMACDMPFFNPGLIRYLTTLTSGCDVVIPYTDDWEPLYALYAKTCLSHMERLIHSGDLKIVRFFPHVRVRRVDREEVRPYDPQGLSLFNMNTPEEFARAEEWWRQLSPTG